MAFRDVAIAAFTAAQTAQRTALVDAAKVTLGPILTEGKVDPKTLVAPHVDVPNRIVVLSTADAAPVHFLVKGDVIKLARRDAGAWVTHRADGSQYPQVTTLTEVGAALAAG